MLNWLYDHGFADVDPTRLVGALQASIWRIERLHPWPFTEQVTFLNFDGTSPVPVNMPSAFRASVRMKDLSTGRRILPIRQEEFEDKVGINYTEPGSPKIYYFEGGQTKLWPVPPVSTGQVKLTHLNWSPAISSATLEASITVPKYYHLDAVINGALYVLYDMTDDAELASRFEGHFTNAVASMVESVFQRQYDMPDHVLMTDPDDFDYDGWTYPFG